MKQSPLHPMRFEPIYQNRIWGGRSLAWMLSAPLPGNGPIGEAWLLCDRDYHPSRVADDPLKGQTIKQLMADYPEQMLGKLTGWSSRFPLLLKFWIPASRSPCRCIHRMGKPTISPHHGKLESNGGGLAFRPGDTLLLPAVAETCLCRPDGVVILLEIALPEGT